MFQIYAPQPNRETEANPDSEVTRNSFGNAERKLSRVSHVPRSSAVMTGYIRPLLPGVPRKRSFEHETHDLEERPI